MNKTLGTVIGIIAGIVIGWLAFYLLSAFGGETPDVLKIICLSAGLTAIYAVCSYFDGKTQQKKFPYKIINTAPFLYVLAGSVAAALTALVLFVKKEIKEQKKNIPQIEYTYEKSSTPNQMGNEGWTEIGSTCAFRSESDGLSMSSTYILFSKGEQITALKSNSSSSNARSTVYNVILGKYYVQGEHFNARISVNGGYEYCNI